VIDPATGIVSVPAGTPAGTYTITYEICETLNPTNCDVAVITVTVDPAAIVANDDIGTPVGSVVGGVAFANVLVNDELNGVFVNPADVTLGFIASTHPGITLIGNDVVVAPGTPVGSYTLTYEICEVLNPTNCDQAIVTVNVFFQQPGIEAVVDYGLPVFTGTGGMSVANVLVNDSLQGVVVQPTDVTIAFVSASHPGVMLAGNSVIVAGGTPAGNYTLVYRICEVADPTTCDTAIVYVPVVNFSIIANIDYGTTVVGSAGGVSLPNVLVNDVLHGVPATNATVTVTQMFTPNAGVNLLGNTVVVNPGTPAGVYHLIYRICEIANPTNCDTALVVVPVIAPVIEAIVDYGASVNGVAGGVSVSNVLGNDLLNGQPLNSANVTTSFVSSSDPGITLSGNSVVVAPGTPAGNYTLIYQICEVINPTNCDTAIVYVPVHAQNISLCLTPKVFLQGPFDPATGMMWDSLRTKGFIPTTEPYSTAPYNTTFTHVGGGGETIANPVAVFGVTGSNAIVDWVFVELRDRNNMSNVLLTRSALLQRDGDIVDVDGVSPLCFNGMGDSLYHITIRHRNHFGVMTAAPKLLISAPVVVVDFRNGAEPEFDLGTTLGNGYDYTGHAQKQVTIGARAMWAGDVNRDAQIKYQGNVTDRTAILNDVLGHPANTTDDNNFDFGFGYHPGDINLDGKVKYQGGQADRTLLLNYLLTYPLNVLFEYNFDFFFEQLP